MGGDDPIGEALAGWPALSMLVAVKLLFGMIDHGENDQRTAADRPLAPGTVPQTARTADRRPGRQRTRAPDSLPPSATGETSQTAEPTSGRSSGPASESTPEDALTVAHLLPAARTARAALAVMDAPWSPDRLADAMHDGHGISNEHASLLLMILKEDVTESDRAPSGPVRKSWSHYQGWRSS
ncbi:hypothetical protein [Micromonospora echinofusca]|uniref:DUF222 domain-containing protein n=1 Tax=Micromonospora echinofusca TaxID=47858 RepID=A0ABS3VT72_MICEH|nr:hypothetical protein [Micromonospora echinofusca]MBO4207713.1 hypothetical protein [Micromonospora echinofusca]